MLIKGLYICLFAIIVSLTDGEQEIVGSDYNLIQPNADDNNLAPKRAALLLDRLMIALQRALDDNDEINGKDISSFYKNNQGIVNNLEALEDILTNDLDVPQRRIAAYDENHKRITSKSVDLQRRGHGSTDHPKGRVWRCYFNAVTCF